MSRSMIPAYVTDGVDHACQTNPGMSRFVAECLAKWHQGDYGDGEADDFGILAAYPVPDGLKHAVPDGCYADVLWVTDENGPDTITILWPSER